MQEKSGPSAHTPLIQNGSRTPNRRSKHVILGALALVAVAGSVALIAVGSNKAAPIALVDLHHKLGLRKDHVHERIITIMDKPSSSVLHSKITSLALTSAEETELLDQHNAVRCMHEEPLMTWDATLATQAQDWADQIKTDDPDKCQGGHSDRNSAFRNGAGENMAWGSKPDYWQSNGKTFANVVDLWYNEVQYYDFDQPGTSINMNEAIGHFTQVVWKASTKLGCGMASCPNGQTVVCQYDPTGNFAGQYEANVDLPTKTAAECNAGDVSVPCASDSTCAEKSASDGSSGGDGGGEEQVAPSCELSASPADTHCKISATGCAGDQISFTCKSPKEGGRWGAYAAYSALNYGFASGSEAFEADYTADCEQCLNICEHEGESSCLDDPAPPPPPPPPPAGACQVSQSGAGGCVLDVQDCESNQQIQYKCTCKTSASGSPSFCASYPGITVGTYFWTSLNTYTRDYSGGCETCTDVGLRN